jgi:hypothetical protein
MVLIYALSPLPPSLSFPFLFLFHTHRIYLASSSSCLLRSSSFFVSSLSYVHFLIYIPLLPVSKPSFHSSASRSGTFKTNTFFIHIFSKSIISPEKCNSPHSLSQFSASAVPLVSPQGQYLFITGKANCLQHNQAK